MLGDDPLEEIEIHAVPRQEVLVVQTGAERRSRRPLRWRQVGSVNRGLIGPGGRIADRQRLHVGDRGRIGGQDRMARVLRDQPVRVAAQPRPAPAEPEPQEIVQADLLRLSGRGIEQADGSGDDAGSQEISALHGAPQVQCHDGTQRCRGGRVQGPPEGDHTMNWWTEIRPRRRCLGRVSEARRWGAPPTCRGGRVAPAGRPVAP